MHEYKDFSPLSAFWFVCVCVTFYTTAIYIKMFLTRFDLLDDRFVVVVLHLSDVQQGVGVPVVGGPVVHKDPRAAAATVHHDAIIQCRVEDISGLHGLCDGEVPGEENKHLEDEEYILTSLLMFIY